MTPFTSRVQVAHSGLPQVRQYATGAISGWLAQFMKTSCVWPVSLQVGHRYERRQGSPGSLLDCSCDPVWVRAVHWCCRSGDAYLSVLLAAPVRRAWWLV